MKASFLLLLSVLIVAVIVFGARSQGDLFKGDVDKALLGAVKSDNLKKFDALLRNGADPNKIFGKRPDDWVMCQVADNDRLEFLKLAIRYGGDINLRNPYTTKSTVKSIFSSPLLCSIRLHNEEAFKFLLDQGVDTNIMACTECKNDRLRGTPITVAEHGNEYKMVYELITHRNGDLSEAEIKGLITGIERTTIDEKSEANNWRLKVAGWLKSQGHEVTPWEATDECRRINCQNK